MRLEATAAHGVAAPAITALACICALVVAPGRGAAAPGLAAPASAAAAPASAAVAPAATSAKLDQVYIISVRDRGASLAIEASFERLAGPGLAVAPAAARFVADFAVERGGAWTPSTPAKACRAGPCRVRYSFRLADAARALDDPELALGEAGAFLAAPRAFLVQPDETWDGAQIRVRMAPLTDGDAACALFPGAGALVARAEDMTDLPACIFGQFHRERLELKGGEVDVVLWPGAKIAQPAALSAWVDRAARAVVAYYGRFPVPKVLLLIRPRRGTGTGGGMTYSGGGAFISVTYGAASTPADLAADWVLTHEMTHLTFPSVPRRHHWLEEGIATYVEPLARVLTGELRAAKVWGDMARDMPRGQPEKGDEGLDHTATWGRTYWGGALFCLVADVRIREATGGKRGLRDALAGIVAAGGNIAAPWSLADTLAAGDKAAGVPVLAALYAETKDKPVTVDLEALWKKLGVAGAGPDVRLDDKTPGAALRRAIAGP